MRRLHEQPVVLLTGTDPLVGIDLGDTLAQAGYRVLGPFGTAAGALSVLERETPALAIVDVMLRDGRCPELVRELRRRGVPFLGHTGCKPDATLAAEFQSIPWLGKPALPEDVVVLCDELSLTSPEPVTAKLSPPARFAPARPWAGGRQPQPLRSQACRLRRFVGRRSRGAGADQRELALRCTGN
jgi:hypothetical protein